MLPKHLKSSAFRGPSLELMLSLSFLDDKIVQKMMHKAYRRNFLMFSAFISVTSFCLTFWRTSEKLGFFSVSFVNHPETHLKSFLLSKNVLTCLSTGATCGTKQLKPQGGTGLRAPSVSVWGFKQKSEIYLNCLKCLKVT